MNEYLTLNYKDKTYTLKELIEDNNNFSDSLKFFNDSKRPDIFFVNDVGYCIALEKVEQLYNLIASSRFSLIEAHNKLHKSPVEWKSGYLGQLWLRAQYLKNSIIWYNSCLDYVYQIIWFAFDFFGEIKTKKDYRRELIECNWSKISEILESKSDQNSSILLCQLKQIRKDKNLKKVNLWANSLKHHGNLSFKELRLSDNYLLNFTEDFTNKDMIGDVLDIDETCETVKLAHCKLIEFINFLLDFINFENIFDRTNEGQFIINSKEKLEYKKIIINMN
ncbi:hypothetical protein [Pedobacter sp. GR22-10]|uniref:hypothetical protein n=1 Tax=Pedobacter sp. GR22-10 TaxID=2994472 RepID=UPI00224766F8|nr:hypothetical protein [Pedobacter sp. GR22-10]MCX2432870.1 hypothetical protein [Pedobacter sp. GR22-10]